MSVKISDDTYWINECHEQEEDHVHISIYLIQHEDSYIIIDTGTNFHRETMQDQVRSLTDGAGPDVVVLSHNDLHHVGNVHAFRDLVQEVEVRLPYSGTTNYFPEDFGIGPAKQYNMGTAFDVRGREIRPIEPLLADRAAVSWTVDRESNILFSSDGFGHYHRNYCNATSIRKKPSYDDILQYHKDTFKWLELINPAELMRYFDEILDVYDIKVIAPAHGSPIMEGDIPDYRRQFEEVVTEIASEGYDISNYFPLD